MIIRHALVQMCLWVRTRLPEAKTATDEALPPLRDRPFGRALVFAISIGAGLIFDRNVAVIAPEMTDGDLWFALGLR